MAIVGIYSSVENLKFLRNEKVGFLFGIADNRQVSLECGKAIPGKKLGHSIY